MRLLQKRKSRRAFALIFVLIFMMLLLTYLIAAQGSVQTSTRLIQRSNERMERAEMTSSLLSLAGASLAAGQANNDAAPATVKSETLEGRQTFKKIDAGDAVYGSLQRVTHREGDALVTITLSGKGVTEESLYLISAARGGAIRVR
jgi:hypothetical protein